MIDGVVLEKRTIPLSSFECHSLSPIPHLHNDIEIVYVKGGSADAYFDGECKKIGTGDISISFPNQVHYYKNSERGEYYVLIFTPDIFCDIKSVFYQNSPLFNTLADKNGFFKTVIQNILTADGKFASTKRIGLINQLVAAVLEDIELTPKINSNSPSMQNILDFCQQNFASDITLEQLESELHISRYHISHLFNQKLGIGFTNYLNSLRIDSACKLLKNSNKTVSEISHAVGFGSIRSFNRAFLQITNTTPVKYRKEI